MNDRQALDWLEQPGIKTVIQFKDRHTNEAMKKAVEALRKQVPKSYTIEHAKERTYRLAGTETIVNVFTFHCPCCGLELGDSDWDGKPNADWADYCERCGQKIDWIHDVEMPTYQEMKYNDCKAEKVGEIRA